ncbi:MAG: ankyrin repeat domain-containing protein [Candidatus Aenigmatarchaeota archaeon]
MKLNDLLIQAAKDGDIRAVKTLLEECANVNAKSNKGRTALMFALDMGHEDIASLLRNAGARY